MTIAKVKSTFVSAKLDFCVSYIKMNQCIYEYKLTLIKNVFIIIKKIAFCGRFLWAR